MQKKSISLVLLVVIAGFSHAATITWAGHTWNVTTGGMAGSNTGSAANVVVDADGYLHLKITKPGNAWTCAEMFSTDNMGFGTYRWQIDGPVDKLDKNVVLGLFPYGPEGGIGADGTNEIDIEYARWGNAAWPNGNYTVYPNSGTTIGEITFNFTLSGTYTTSSFVWTGTSIAYLSQEGFKAVGDNTGVIKNWTYAPSNPSVNIPQRGMPLGMNLWLCSGCGGAPGNGQPVDIIVRSFQFIPLGTNASAMKRDAGEAGAVSISRRNGNIVARFNIRGGQNVSLRIVDSRGCIVRNYTLLRSQHEQLIQGLGPGVYVAQMPEMNAAERFVLLR
jgi:hypothetical protein